MTNKDAVFLGIKEMLTNIPARNLLSAETKSVLESDIFAQYLLVNIEKLMGLIEGQPTTEELYEYRLAYNALFVNTLNRLYHTDTWSAMSDTYLENDVIPVKSKKHSDGELCFGGGWFVVVVDLPKYGQVSNHYRMEYWDLFNVTEVELAPKWDGHTPQKGLDRMLTLLEDPYFHI